MDIEKFPRFRLSFVSIYFAPISKPQTSKMLLIFFFSPPLSSYQLPSLSFPFLSALKTDQLFFFLFFNPGFDYWLKAEWHHMRGTSAGSQLAPSTAWLSAVGCQWLRAMWPIGSRVFESFLVHPGLREHETMNWCVFYECFSRQLGVNDAAHT